MLVVAKMMPMGTTQMMGMRRQTIIDHQVKCVLQTKMTTNERTSIMTNRAAYHLLLSVEVLLGKEGSYQSGASSYFFIKRM